MSDTQSRVEARLYGSYWDDGLLDLFCGIGLLAIGIGWWLDLVVMAAIAPPILIPLWAPLRRRIVEPRAGYVEFSQARQSQTRTGLKMTFILLVGTFLLGLGLFLYLQRAESPEPLPGLAHYIAGLPAVLLAVGALIGGQITAARRFRTYALLLFLFGVTTIVMGWGPAMPMLVGGISVTLSGSVLVVHFLRASAEFEETAT